jgi:N-acetylmuramoyl-L-alanine amidase
MPFLKPKTKRKVNAISKLVLALSRSLLGRENLRSLVSQIHLIQKRVIEFIKEHRTVKIIHIFRNYSALIVVISSALLVSSTNFAAGRESSGFLFGYFGETENYENPLKDKMSLKTNQKNNLALAPLIEANPAPDPSAKNDESDLLVQGQALEAENRPVRKDPEEDGGVIIYEVRDGDSVSLIAQKYKISVNTILWANEMDNVNSIMPGDKIFILPVSGLSYTVKEGDSIDDIAKKYKADKDKIIAFNEIPANGDLEKGQEILIPDGEKEVPRTQTRSNTLPSSGIIAERPYQSFESSGKSALDGKAGTGHRFPYGYCTWYVASRRYVPWGGNAGTWLYHAKAAGYSTSKSPRVGSIIVTSESWWGHVGIVEKVSGGEITISEMNYKGFAKKSTRVLSSASRVIKGYIH